MLDDQSQTRRIAELEAELAMLRKEAAIPYRAVMDDMSELIVRWQPDGTRTFVNRAYCRLFGTPHEELIGTSFWPLITDADREEVQRRIASLTPDEPVTAGRHRAVRPDGSVFWMEWVDRAIFDADGRLRELQSVGRDITDRVQAEAQAERIARGDAAARATAAIAHDMRNVLQVIVSLTCAPEWMHALGSDAAELLQQAVTSTEQMLNKLSNLTHGLVMQPETLDLPQRVRHLRGLLSEIVGPAVRLECQLTDAPCSIEGDPTQIDQVLLNLVRNAADAMPRGGSVRIEVARRDDAGPERQAVLRVVDQGTGINPSVLPRIFDARVTTKPDGQGLGLATVQAIVRGHRGRIDVQTSESGTTFQLEFPLVS